jgi:ubiquinol-cytochrome c reductase cytochrome b subunit
MRAWLQSRTGVLGLLNKFLEEPVPARGRWFYVFGSSTLTAFAVQVVTGIAMLFFYRPTVGEAYSSVLYIMNDVPLGWLIRSLHYWSATAMVLLLLLHLSRVFFSAAYKYPREAIWILGVMLFFTTSLQFATGNFLPFHEFGYWTGVVGTYMFKYVPFVGDGLYAIATGGDYVGQATLSRFFLVHVLVLPGLIAVLIAAHLFLVVKHGIFGWWVNYRAFRGGPPPPGTSEERFEHGSADESVPFWPRQAIRDATASLLLLVSLFALAILVRAPVFNEADPASLDFIPRAQWYFMPYQRLLDFMPGFFLTALATWVFAIVLFIAMVSLPFLDKDVERNLFRRPAMTVLGITLIGMFVMLLVIEVMQDPAIYDIIPPGTGLTETP